MIYRWDAVVRSPYFESGIAENQGIIAADSVNMAFDMVMRYMSGDDYKEENLLRFSIEPWETDIISVDKDKLADFEKNVI